MIACPKKDQALTDAINAVLTAYNHGQYRYLNDFVKLNLSGSDMLHLGLFPDAKEITESYGALNAVLSKMKLDRNDSNITLVCVGDGTTPRTAALFAFRTKWSCISVDPLLNKTKIPSWEQEIKRLTCIPTRIEEVNLKFGNPVVIAVVHGHAPMASILEHVKSPIRSMVAIECCVAYNHPNIDPKPVYRDAGVWSPKNLVKIWRNI